MAERDLIVRIIGDDRALQQSFTRTERRLQQFEGRTNRAAQGVRGALTGGGFGGGTLLFGSAAFVSSAALAAVLTKSVDAASDLNEEISKSRQIFGESSRAVDEWSQQTARSIGVSRIAALQATGVFGNLFNVIGIAPQAAAEMSRALVELAADLASFNNASPEDVLQAIRSGLIGEAEPLRRYGVLLSEARVQQTALANTGKETVKALTDQEKALARYEIILQDTKAAQGDFARTSEGLANQTRILRANLSDLAANLGSVLLPAVNEAVSAVNALFDGVRALNQLGGTTLKIDLDVDLTQLIRARGELASLLGEGDLLVQTLTEVISRITEARQAGQAAAGPGLGIGRALEQQAERDANEVQRQALEVDRARRRARKAFDELAKGLGLKLDQAQLTASLTDDVAALRELERAILRQIDREGRTFELVQRLTDVRLELARTLETQAETAAQASRDAFEDSIDALSLRLEVARTTPSLADDQVALRTLEQAILRRISDEGRTTDLLRRLFEVRQQQADVQRQIRERDRQTRRGQQFEALGLTEEGDERVPGVGALRRRLGTLEEQIKGTPLDTERTRAQLDRIRRVLSGKFGQVGREVREAILGMFRDISNALDQGAKQEGPLTQFQKRGIEPLIVGLGLSEEEVKALRQRLSRVGPGGTTPGQGIGAFGFSTPVTGTTGGGNIIVNGDIIVRDPRDVDAFVREVQRRTQRTAGQRRGTQPGRGG